jgi:PAS domain S-box-containing protein
VQHQATDARKDDGEPNRVSPPLKRIATAWRSLPGLRGGIGWRLLVRVLLFSSVVTLLLTLMQLYLDYRRDVGAIDQRISEIDSGYRRSLGEGLWRLDARQLQLQVEGILRLPDIRYVELREATDRAAPLVVTAGSRQANPPTRREFRIFYTNRGAEQLVGILAVEATFDRIYRQLSDTAAVILVGQAIETFIVSFFILLIVHRLITRHLTGIATSLRGYDLHGSQAPLRLDRRRPQPADELDRLVEAFNDMYARLQAAYDDLGEREARIRRLVDSNIIGIFIWDFEGRIREANDEFLRMVDYDREDLVAGRIRWADLTPPDWRDRNDTRIEQQKTSGRFEPFEKEYTRKDGSRVPVLIGGATFEEGGNQGVAFVLDLTARKCAEDALREREAQLAEARRELRQMIDTIPIPVASYSADARRDFVNAAWKRYTGVSDEAALGTEWSIVAHPDHIAAGEKVWRDALATGEPWHTEERVRRADGQYRWFAIDRVTARDENGKIIKWYGTAYDIEDRKRAEERLRVQHTVALILAEAATIEEAAPRILRAMGECLGWDVGVLWRVDREAEALRCVELWHKASIEVPEFERVSREFTFGPGLGLPGRVWSSLEPEYIPDVTPDENFPRAPIAEREGLRAAFAFPILLGGEVLGVIEFFSREIRQPDQDLLNDLATIGSQIGQFIERKRAEEAFRKAQMQLAHANRVATMGQLSASIAHEVNQPITAAITYALAARRWLSAEPPNFPEVDDALSLIVKEGNRAGDVVRRIRALIEKVPARKDAVAINEAIVQVIALTRTEAANNSVSVRTQLVEGLPLIQGDRVQLQQVLLNLIINAIEAMRDVGEKERELLISTRHEPDGVSVEMRDSGPGFAPAALERAFEAFYTTKPGGLGLGLSICRSIIEAHDGRLWASPNIPCGATFEFTVPAHPDIAS